MEFESVNDFLYDQTAQEAYFKSDSLPYSLSFEINEELHRIKFTAVLLDSGIFYEGEFTLESFSNYLIAKFRNSIEKYRRLVISLISQGCFSFNTHETHASLVFRIQIDESEFEHESFKLERRQKESQADGDGVQKKILDMTNRIHQSEREVRQLGATLDEEVKTLNATYEKRLKSVTTRLNKIEDLVSRLLYEQNEEILRNYELEEKRIDEINDVIENRLSNEIETISEKILSELDKQHQKISLTETEVLKTVTNLYNVIPLT